MDKEIYKVLVPHDFSEVANNAVSHAAAIAKHFNGEVHLLHIVSKQKMIEEAREKLKGVALEAEKLYEVDTHNHVRIGSIFEDVGDLASEIKAGFVVMGTHGAKGIQKIIGSRAIRVIVDSEVPFIVVQSKAPKDAIYDRIVVPIDYSDVTKQKLSFSADMALHFDSQVHIFVDHVEDTFLKTKLQGELSFAKRYCDERNVNYTISHADKNVNFKKQLVAYAESVDADLIAIVNTQDGALIPDFLGSSEQNILNNKPQIPILITNPTQREVPGGVLGT